MPHPSLFLRSPQGELELGLELEFSAPSCLLNPETNNFDRAFTAEIDVSQWHPEWMKWEVAELGLPRSYGASTFSLPDCSADDDSSKEDESLCTFFADAPFEFDHTTPSSSIMPLDFTKTLSPADLQLPGPLRRSFHAFSSLTESEERVLQNIAMPSRLLSGIKPELGPTSPDSSSSYHSPSLSPEPETRTRKTRKRKASTSNMAVPNALTQSRKTGHNAIEKRYRTNLNDKINCLRLGIPSDGKGKELDAKGMASKMAHQKDGKAAILTRALEYIKHLETTTDKIGGQLDVLKTRVGAFEKLAMRGSVVLDSRCIGAQGILVQVKSQSLESIQDGMCCL